MLGPYIFGKYVITVISSYLMESWSLYPGRLINIVFACLFLGFSVPSLKSIWKEGGPQFCYGWLVGMGQYMVGIGISVILIFNFGTSLTYIIGAGSILLVTGIAFLSGWMHKPQRK